MHGVLSSPLLVHVAVVEVLVPVAVAAAAAADGVGVGDAVAATCRAPAGGEAGSEGIQRAGRGAACAGQGLGLDRWAARGNVQGRSLLLEGHGKGRAGSVQHPNTHLTQHRHPSHHSHITRY